MEIRNVKYTTQKSTLFYDGDPHKIKKTCQKKCPQKYLKIKYSLCHYFLELILFLTHCQWLSASYNISLNLPLNILDDFIHFSMTHLLHTAEAFQQIHWTHFEQQDAKVSVKMMSEKTKYFPTNSFHTSCEVRYLSHLLGEKSTHFLLFSSFPPHPSTSLHHFCSYQPQLPQLFQLHSENDHKTYPLKWKKWEKLVRIQIKRVDLKEPIGKKER